MCLFFFKQKTAYEMRISDWSSDVCSSDLSYSQRLQARDARRCHRVPEVVQPAHAVMHRCRQQAGVESQLAYELQPEAAEDAEQRGEIGRASCRERVCQDV